MDFVPNPDRRVVRQLKNERAGKQWAVGKPKQNEKDPTHAPEKIFKFPRIEALLAYAEKQGYVNGDNIFAAFILCYLVGLGRYLTMDTEQLQAEQPYEMWIRSVFEPVAVSKWFLAHLEVPAVIGVLYCIMLWAGPKFMESRERPKWIKKYIIAWNAFLVVFSTLGSYKVIGMWWNQVIAGPFDSKVSNLRHVTCHSGDEQCTMWPVACLWLMLFCASKVPEMIDTVLLIVCKKKVIFLHWFHHLTVMMFCWLSFATRTPVGTMFAGMNYFVHSWMYAWYGLAAFGLKPTRYMSQMVTILQIVQMILGSILAFYTFLASSCNNHIYATTSGIMIYGSYLFLFVKFFINAYCRKRPRRSADASKAKRS